MSFNFSNIRNSPSTQSSSHSFPTPSTTPFTHTPSTTPHFPPAQNNPNINPTLLDEDVIPARFIDALTNQFSFGDSEQDLQHNLHGFAKADGAWPPESRYCYTFILTCSHFQLNQGKPDLQIQLKNTFTLSHEQKANVHIVAGDIIFEASQITFMTIHFDVEVQQSQKELQFTNIYGNPAQEKILMAYIKQQCSSIYSVIGDGTCTLSDFVFESAQWYKIGGPTLGLTPACTTRLAILHHFAYENPELLDCEEDVEDDSPPMEDDSGSQHHSAQEPQKKKQKHGGRVPRGEDFWLQVEKWFDACRKQWGNSWTTPNWNSYISETIAKDEDCYKVHVIHNPFMEDVHTDDRFFTGPITSAGLGAAEDLLQEMV
ncbi:hypothetical protein F5J12DRAFT_786153 [Pisolithus orientalis]|uniref:uncharacterized protein n=1 Tax=Pisolithus orientalis TaxID=936130 RepID=UPI002224083E|nr:uncharacterized protein F5J12DRAFT_786153 [Pisolithus orientalis]KAI5992359.1 hypothetical protein F5J12DRAFT_786153 [Pisolithus orientalis]